MRLPLTKRRFPAAASRRARGRVPALLSIATAVAAAAAVLIAASPARANGLDKALCSADSSRVSIPGSLPVNACFDGHNLVIENSQQFPIEVRTDHGGVPVVAPTASADLPGSIVSMMAPMDDGLTPPNYKLTIPISSQRTTITITQAPKDIVSDYAWGEALYGALGGTLVTGLGKSLVPLLGGLTTVTQNYRTCLIAATSWLGRIGCAAGYDANVVYALGRFGLTLAPDVIQATYNLVMTVTAADQAVGQAAAWINGTKQFTIAAASGTAPQGGGSGSGSVPVQGGSVPVQGGQPVPSQPAAGYHGGFAATVDQYATTGDSGHKGPGDQYAAGPTYPAGATIHIYCYVNGESITNSHYNDTTTVWDLSDDGYWYTDAWLFTNHNGPVVPACTAVSAPVDQYATTGDSGHKGPGDQYAAGPTYPAGATIHIYCYVNGESITNSHYNDTTTVWDLSDDGYWYTDAWLFTNSNGPVVPACG